MIITIHGPEHTFIEGQWHVWAHIEPGDPIQQHESFLIGTGPTKQAAAVDAIAELLRTADELLRGVIEAGVV